MSHIHTQQNALIQFGHLYLTLLFQRQPIIPWITKALHLRLFLKQARLVTLLLPY